jgi:hypothetical protein
MKKKLLITITLIVVLLGGVYAQQLEISGTVTSASDGLPYPGRQFWPKGTKTLVQLPMRKEYIHLKYLRE